MNLERLQLLQQHTKQEEADFAFITNKDSLFYLTGLLANPHERLMALFILQDSYVFVIPKMEQELVRQAGYQGDILPYSDHEDVWQLIKEKLQENQLTTITSILMEESTLTFARMKALESLGHSIRFTNCEHVLMNQRLVKSDDELEILQEAAAFADAGVEFGIKALYTGVTELEVIAEIEYELKKQGISEMAFQTTVLFGDHAASPHGKPGTRALKEGEFVLFDLGVVVNGYCSDITRTVAYGEVPEKHQLVYNTVLEAEETAVAAVKPDVVIGELDTIARTVIENAGFGDYFTHRLGHGLGINVHEFPSMSQNNVDVLLEGMTFTIEPGIYIPGEVGVRIEDDVVVTDSGVETLTIFPKALINVPPREH
ncbi:MULTISPECIES: M24 family metallopeptidase [Shouchella]|uniref:Xaa-Pro peptidase family protein n=1 Tax=Shouchella hunanensis TaxID=766894 RepID=A0ABY7WC20_9BACI|nr:MULTISPECIES: Xaa-Pro peptidase family protein [Shouchella]WDF04215.1 Xaa-Pro peptidase family protein [Shouchella hunanensis]